MNRSKPESIRRRAQRDGRVLPILLTAFACEAATPNDGSGTNASEDSLEGDTGETGTDAPEFGGACHSAVHLGGFIVALEIDDYSSISGWVADGVVPGAVLETLVDAGECQLVAHATPFCDPPCTGGDTCDLTGMCIPYPVPQPLATVDVTGLEVPVSMEPNAVASYYATDLPHPVFVPGAEIELVVEGDVFPGFRLQGAGFAPLTTESPEWVISPGEPLTVEWHAGAGEVETEINIAFSIDQHGAIPQQIVCTVPDTGSYTVPASLIDALFNAGISGFPNGYLRRRTADKLELEDGRCIDFQVVSAIKPAITVN